MIGTFDRRKQLKLSVEESSLSDVVSLGFVSFFCKNLVVVTRQNENRLDKVTMPTRKCALLATDI